LLTDRQTGRQTDRQTDRQTENPLVKHTILDGGKIPNIYHFYEYLNGLCW